MHQVNINQVAENFASWRSSRARRGRTPTPLKQQAVSLVGQHTKRLITTRLGINNKMLDRWMHELNVQASAPSGFIAITAEVPPPAPVPLSLAIDLHGGAQLRLSGGAGDIAAFLLCWQQGGGR
jgi:hypothetical protein